MPAATAPRDLPSAAADALDAAREALPGSFDMRTGGWGGAPKFPQPMATSSCSFASTSAHRRQAALEVVRRALDAMADGGIHDQLGGGFARYATDAVWLVPHFEKMLYDNAQLARVYLHAWQVTAEPRYAEVARDDARLRGARAAVDGAAFAASLDADTDGEEGATYVWRADEMVAVLGADAPLFDGGLRRHAHGNWEGTDHPVAGPGRRRAGSHASRSAVERIDAQLSAARDRLLRIRDARPQPTRDGKVLAAWNGLAAGRAG